MSGTNLSLRAAGRRTLCGSRMVSSHVLLQSLGIGSWWWLPARDLFARIEVIWEVFGVAVTHLPVGWQTAVILTIASISNHSYGNTMVNS